MNEHQQTQTPELPAPAMPFSSTDTAVPGFEPTLLTPITPQSLHTLSSFWRTTVMKQTPKGLLPELIASLSHTLRVMAELDVERTTVDIGESGSTRTFSGLVDVYGPTERLIVLSLPEKTALAITQRIVGDYADGTRRDLIADCVGELTNITVGRAVSLLKLDTPAYVFSTPVTIAGDRQEICWGDGYDAVKSCFTSDAGHFQLQLLSHNGEISLPRKTK